MRDRAWPVVDVERDRVVHAFRARDHYAQMVQPGLTLVMVVPHKQYVVANFKETQMDRIASGDPWTGTRRARALRPRSRSRGGPPMDHVRCRRWCDGARHRVDDQLLHREARRARLAPGPALDRRRRVRGYVRDLVGRAQRYRCDPDAIPFPSWQPWSEWWTTLRVRSGAPRTAVPITSRASRVACVEFARAAGCASRSATRRQSSPTTVTA